VDSDPLPFAYCSVYLARAFSSSAEFYIFCKKDIERCEDERAKVTYMGFSRATRMVFGKWLSEVVFG
jgi:hypothetical protein